MNGTYQKSLIDIYFVLKFCNIFSAIKQEHIVCIFYTMGS